MLLTFFQRRDPKNVGSERKKGNMIIKYANYIFFILLLVLLFFMIYFLSKLNDLNNDQPKETDQTANATVWYATPLK